MGYQSHGNGVYYVDQDSGTGETISQIVESELNEERTLASMTSVIRDSDDGVGHIPYAETDGFWLIFT